MSEGFCEALSQPLDRSRVSQRQGAGGKQLDYIETHDAIRTANRIFGFGKWGHVVEDLTCLGEEAFTNAKGKEGIRVGYRCTVKLTVEDCQPVSGIGYGDAAEYGGSRITPHELASKEAESDALKRALRNYGDQFGLILYAKTEQERNAIELTAQQNSPERAKLDETIDGLTRADPSRDWLVTADKAARRDYGTSLARLSEQDVAKLRESMEKLLADLAEKAAA